MVYVLQEVPEGWDHEEGYVDGDLLEKHLPREKIDRSYFVCGPPPMMDVVEEALLERGVARERLVFERFELA